MKNYQQLNSKEQARAIKYCLTKLLTDVANGSIRFDKNEKLQERIDAATAKAYELRTSWFAHEYIMDTCGKELEAMAKIEAEGAAYSQPNEIIIAGIAGITDTGKPTFQVECGGTLEAHKEIQAAYPSLFPPK